MCCLFLEYQYFMATYLLVNLFELTSLLFWGPKDFKVPTILVIIVYAQCVSYLFGVVRVSMS